MNTEDLIGILKTERECVMRDCDRDCSKCELALPSPEPIVEALTVAINEPSAKLSNANNAPSMHVEVDSIPSMDVVKGIMALEVNRKETGCNFTYLAEPTPFKDLFGMVDFDRVQIYSARPITRTGMILGFWGVFSWTNNVIKPFDGDSYSDDMLVYGYEYFSNQESGVVRGVCILTV